MQAKYVGFTQTAQQSEVALEEPIEMEAGKESK